VNVLEQGIVDQGLVVPTPGLVYLVSKILEHGIAQSNGDLGLSGFRPDDGATFGSREIDVSIPLSRDLPHSTSSV
jgi:hypothetical protein